MHELFPCFQTAEYQINVMSPGDVFLQGERQGLEIRPLCPGSRRSAGVSQQGAGVRIVQADFDGYRRVAFFGIAEVHFTDTFAERNVFIAGIVSVVDPAKADNIASVFPGWAHTPALVFVVALPLDLAVGGLCLCDQTGIHGGQKKCQDQQQGKTVFL